MPVTHPFPHRIVFWLFAGLLAVICSAPVRSATTGAITTKEVTDQVSVIFSGLRYNRSTGTFDTQATLTNTSDDSIQAPLELEVNSISAEMAALGNTEGTSADGHPFVTVPLADDVLAPGETARVVLQFANPTRARFTFTHRVFGSLVSTVSNLSPVANAGSDETVWVGDTAILSAALSADPELSGLAYSWKLIEKPQSSQVNLIDPNKIYAEIIPDQPGDYVVELIVNDGVSNSTPATVRVTALPYGTAHASLLPLSSFPGGIKLGTTASVNFTVTLAGNSGIKASRVVLQALDSTGHHVISELGTLNDSGVYGDQIPGNQTYSRTVLITGNEEGKLLYRAVAEVPEVGEIVSDIHAINVTRFELGPLPSDLSQVIEIPNTNADVIGNELLVQFSATASPSEVEAAATSIGGEVFSYLAEGNIYQLRFPNDSSIDALRDATDTLLSDPLVARVEPNFLLNSISSFPDDRELNKQWGVAKIRADEAWLISKSTEDVGIALIDSGIDCKHGDLKNRLLQQQGFDYVDFDDNPCVTWGLLSTTQEQHGTLVAGVLAAEANNGEGITGLAWGSKVVPYRVESNSGVTIAGLVAAIYRATANERIKIINISLAGPAVIGNGINYYAALLEAVKNAHQNNKLIVAGAGNDITDTPYFPAAMPSVMAVGATNPNDQLWIDSANKGSNHGHWVDIYAPGWQIYSTFPGDYLFDGYEYNSGTSFATPYVSGAAAIAWSTCKKCKPDEIQKTLVDTAFPLAGHKGGRLDLFEAVFNGSFESGALNSWEIGNGSASVVKSWKGATADDPESDGENFLVIKGSPAVYVYHEIDVQPGVQEIPIRYKVRTDAEGVPCMFQIALVNSPGSYWTDTLPDYFQDNSGLPDNFGDGTIPALLMLVTDGWEQWSTRLEVTNPGKQYLRFGLIGNHPMVLENAEECTVLIDHIEFRDDDPENPIPGSPGL
jgi:thermitase